MAETAPQLRRRFTLVELLVVLSLAALLAIIAIPVLRDTGIDEAQAADQRLVQDAVRRYFFETEAYPAYGPPELPGLTLVEPWAPGSIPSDGSEPSFAGIRFEATAITLSSGATVRLFPDYLGALPKYANDAAADGTQRWRVDSKGNVHIEVDGRSY